MARGTLKNLKRTRPTGIGLDKGNKVRDGEGFSCLSRDVWGYEAVCAATFTNPT